MVHAIRMPKPGQMTEECVLTAWHKREGDPVAKGDLLFEIETDKSAMEVESFEAGILLRRLVEEGATVPVNAICAYVGAPGEEVPDEAPGPERTPPPTEGRAPAPGDTTTGDAASGDTTTGDAATARARLPLPDDRLTTGGRVAISPRARRLAAESGIDPRAIAGTGPDGRIVERDVRAVVAGRDGRRAGSSPLMPVEPVPATTSEMGDGEAPRPLSRMRRIIADRLTLSATTIPHFTVTVAVDATGLLDLRRELKAGGAHLTVTDFVLFAAAQSLVEFPDVNSRTDGVSVWPRRRVHLGVAVSLPAGLVVPVIRDADRLGLGQLHDRAAALAAAAREGSLAVDDMTGSTFTVSNLGMFAVEEFSAIINPGEAAILAVASAMPTAVAIGDGLAVRSVMRLTLSADHRLVDGEMGARFLHAVRRRLEDADGLRLSMANS